MAYMNKFTLPFLTLLSFILILMSGCSSLSNNHQQITEHQNITERTKKLEALSDWKIKGKLGMISPKERHSLTLNWFYQGDSKRQTLNLTTVLGIQIFNLESVNDMHVINVDGERYQSPDLNTLLSSLTGFTLGLTLSESASLSSESLETVSSFFSDSASELSASRSPISIFYMKSGFPKPSLSSMLK